MSKAEREVRGVRWNIYKCRQGGKQVDVVWTCPVAHHCRSSHAWLQLFMPIPLLRAVAARCLGPRTLATAHDRQPLALWTCLLLFGCQLTPGREAL